MLDDDRIRHHPLEVDDTHDNQGGQHHCHEESLHLLIPMIEQTVSQATRPVNGPEQAPDKDDGDQP